MKIENSPQMLNEPCNNQIFQEDPSIRSTHHSSNISHRNEESQQQPNQYFQSKKIEKSPHLLNESCNYQIFQEDPSIRSTHYSLNISHRNEESQQQPNQYFQSKKIEKSPQMVNEAHNNQIFHEDPTIMSTQYSLNISHRNEESQQSNQFNQIPYEDPSIRSTHYSLNISHSYEKSQQSNQQFQPKIIGKSRTSHPYEKSHYRKITHQITQTKIKQINYSKPKLEHQTPETLRSKHADQDEIPPFQIRNTSLEVSDPQVNQTLNESGSYDDPYFYTAKIPNRPVHQMSRTISSISDVSQMELTPTLEAVLPNRHIHQISSTNSSTSEKSQIELNSASEEEIHAIEKPTPTSMPKRILVSDPNKESTKENKKFLKELPKIAPKDIIGKELCTICLKEVKETEQSISCNTCDRWTHRKCCLIKIKKFRRLSKLKSFDWFCKNCREDDFKPTENCSQTTYEIKDLPDDFQVVMKTKNDLLVIHLNCRSLVQKLEELQFIIDKIDPDIICLTETWFDHSIPKNSHIPEGFSIIRKDRSEQFQQKYKKNKGGGVAILYKSHLNLEKKKTLTDENEDVLWAQVNMKNSFLLGVIYRPKYSELMEGVENEESLLEKNIRKASEISSQIIITGDFNADMRQPDDKDTFTLQNIYSTYGLNQQIKKATRIDPKTGKGTVIDHLWTSPEIELKNSGTFLGLSDHLGTYVKLPKTFTHLNKPTFAKSRNFKNYEKIKFASDIQKNIASSEIKNLIDNNKIHNATETLINIIHETASTHAPIKYRKKKTVQKVPWSTPELKNQIEEKNKLLQDFYSTKHPILKTRVSAKQNKIKKMKYNLKSSYITEELDKAGTDPAKLYKVYNQLIGKYKPQEDIEPDGMTQEKADKYNKYFTDIGQTLVDQNKKKSPRKPQKIPKNIPRFVFKEETTTNIEKIIDSLKEKTATGADEINIKLIKDIKKEISPLLTDLINLGYRTNSFPNCLKSAIIKPIHKKEGKNNISNYRPIAILPALSKVFERAASNQLVEYLEQNNLLNISQHAYRKLHSPMTCLAETLNHIYKAIDSKQHAALVSLDLSKAFDCLNHKLLLQKLEYLGLHNSTIGWMSSYLQNRTQVTKFKHYTSKSSPTSTGVPQGSILGPLLFICFTNDFPEIFDSTCKVNAYADDTQLLITANTLPELKTMIEEAIVTAQNWYESNLMKLNADKTSILIFNTSPESKNMKINTEDENGKYEIDPEPNIEILGILIDNELNWKKQINRIKRNAMGKIRNIHRVNHFLSRKHRMNLYNAIISPQFDYGDILWGGCNQSESKSLQRIQNFAIKSILGKKKKYSTRKCFKELKYLTLDQRRHVHYTVFAHKAILGKSSQKLHEQIAIQIPPFNTRSSTKNKLLFPSHNTNKFRRSPLYKMIEAWNSTPSNLPKDNIRLHKNHFQKFLIAESYPD